MKKLVLLLLVTTLISCQAAFSQSEHRQANRKNYTVRAVAEFGFLGALSHNIQFGKNGTYFSYVKDGGQDVLFTNQRFSFELDYKQKNTWIFLYQPLRLESSVYLDNDLRVDNAVFPAGSSVDLLYNFPFFRFSYLRELATSNPTFNFGIGGSLQLRNATITFRSTDGSRFRTNRDVGPVPTLKIRTRKEITPFAYAELEADGMYAPISYLNGSDNEVVGAILDASLRGGFKVSKPISAFLNFRYLSGGAAGTSSDVSGPGDGFTENWLNFGSVTAGIIYAW